MFLVTCVSPSVFHIFFEQFTAGFHGSPAPRRTNWPVAVGKWMLPPCLMLMPIPPSARWRSTGARTVAKMEGAVGVTFISFNHGENLHKLGYKLYKTRWNKNNYSYIYRIVWYGLVWNRVPQFQWITIFLACFLPATIFRHIHISFEFIEVNIYPLEI